MKDQPLDLDELREQLEEFALHMKPGTTKGKHRTAIFDTLELTKLVQALINERVVAELGIVPHGALMTDLTVYVVDKKGRYKAFLLEKEIVDDEQWGIIGNSLRKAIQQLTKNSGGKDE